MTGNIRDPYGQYVWGKKINGEYVPKKSIMI